MIHESYYWKKELLDNFTVIAKFRQLKRRQKQSFVKIEKAILMGAYIIRKLNEAQKVPPELLKTKETISLFKSKGTIVDHFNWHQLGKHYHLASIKKEIKDWGDILNLLIHSYSLVYTMDSENQPDGLLLNTDWTKTKSLFAIPFSLILTIFLTVSEGDIITSSYQRIIGKDEEPGEMKLITANYTYPVGFELIKEINNTMRGNLYARVKIAKHQ